MDFISSHGTKSIGLPFSDAVRAGNVLHLSGQIGNLPGRLELVPGGLGPETRQMMENIARVLNSAGLLFNDEFKWTAMLSDMSRDAEFHQLILTYFDVSRLPAPSAFGVSALALGAAVEMECCAWMG